MHSYKNKCGKWLCLFRNTILIVLLLIVSFLIYYNIVARVSIPEVENTTITEKTRDRLSKDYYKIEENWLRKNGQGLWEMYIEGGPFELGVISGKLTKELIQIQEQAFVDQISEYIPSKIYLRFLKYFIGWFNRDLDKHVIDEYKKEIYGISLSASDKFDYISDNYQRMLNYHAAHDIGHALQDLALVGCTSFAVKDEHENNNLIVGRNFDFYINDDFALNKIVVFVKPESGYKFMCVTWASMIGVVSGMNDQGLTVTINAAKSEIPYRSATPVSLLAREILKYAKNTAEAIEISRKRKIFVSEALLIASAIDNKTIIIEKSPSKLDIYSTDKNYIISSNHFQSDAFKKDELNIQHIKESASYYRQKRCEQLILKEKKINYTDAGRILRDIRGLNGVNIGIGNEKAMNQMISHHSVIFMPAKLMVWVSTSPYQLGEYLAYDLDQVFRNSFDIKGDARINDTSLTILADPFMDSSEYINYLEFVRLSKMVRERIKENKELEKPKTTIENMINLNSEYYLGYLTGGNYYYNFKDYDNAEKYYNMALSREMETTTSEIEITEKLKFISKIKNEFN